MPADASRYPREDPELTADELTTLTQFLDHVRATLLRQAEGVSDADLDRRIEPSTMTLGGLLSHMAWVEDWWFGVNLHGREEDPAWADADWEADDDWDWTSAATRPGDETRALLVAAIERSRVDTAVAAERGGLDTLSARPHPRSDKRRSLRWILVHMIEEYARHCGHADLLRERVDGAVDL